jgi:hypothetical protein
MAVRHRAKVLGVTKVTLPLLHGSRVRSRCKFVVTGIGYFSIEIFTIACALFDDCTTKLLAEPIEHLNGTQVYSLRSQGHDCMANLEQFGMTALEMYWPFKMTAPQIWWPLNMTAWQIYWPCSMTA